MSAEANKIEKVSILGCGWLGKALGKYLVEKGYQVKGSVTHWRKFPGLDQLGIQPYELRLMPKAEGSSLNSFLDADLLVVAIPPSVTGNELETYYVEQMRTIRDAVERLPISKVIHISSTSVYKNTNQEVTENSDTLADIRHQAMLLAEEAFRVHTKLDATILRCGGLMGYDRIPGKYFAGAKDLDTAKVPVNFVHRDDVVRIIEQVILQNKWNKVYNVVAPEHPGRKEIYLANAAKFGFAPPTFDEKAPTPPHKVVSSNKLIQQLGYTFQYPDPMSFPYTPSTNTAKN